MSSTSTKQARFMSAAAHNAEFARKAGIPQSVAREFHEADAGKKYGAHEDMRQRMIRILTQKGK